MEKENIFFANGEEKRRRKRRKIFGEGKYCLRRRRKSEKENKVNIWRRKRFCQQRRGNTLRENDEIKMFQKTFDGWPLQSSHLEKRALRLFHAVLLCFGLLINTISRPDKKKQTKTVRPNFLS